jgi:hypothetical protein
MPDRRPKAEGSAMRCRGYRRVPDEQGDEVDPNAPDGSTDGHTPPREGWTPPDAGASTGDTTGPVGIHVEVEDADGPPPPPPARRRRRRRRALIAGAVIVVLGVPSGLVVVSTLGSDDVPSATGGDDQDGDVGEAETPGPGNDGDPPDGVEALDPPDLDSLGGVDAVYGRLLIDIDASEQIMMDFQDQVAAAFSTPPASSDELLEMLQGIGATGRDQLLIARDRLDDELDVDGAEEIRGRYLAHLDSWAEYMDAVSDDPGVLTGEGVSAGFTVVINATADAFARALEEELPAGADASVRAYADDLLDRGFRGSGDSQV